MLHSKPFRLAILASGGRWWLAVAAAMALCGPISAGYTQQLGTVGPYNPSFAVDGLAVGGLVNPDSAIYMSYTCQPSDDFAGFTWCKVEHTEKGNFGLQTAWMTILHSSANRVALITKVIAPAIFRPGDVDREIQRLSRGFGPAQILSADRPDVPHAVLAAWGAVTLTPLDEAALGTLSRDEEIHRGLITDFLGDPHKSARIGLPVFSIGGGPGYLWGAKFNDAGRGTLQISAVDASALAPLAPVAPSPLTPSPEIVPARPPQQPEAAVPATPSPQLAAPAPKTMDVIDFLVDWRSLNGQTVTVTGCSLRGADTLFVYCSAGSQGHLGGVNGRFSIDSDTLAREDLRRALRKCAGLEEADECRADVTGNVTEDVLGGPEIKDAAMKWAATPAPPQSSQSTAPSPQAPAAAPPEAMPAAERAVIDAVEQARQDYASGANDMQKGASRPTRARSICAAIPDRRAAQWVGNVSEISSNGEGSGVLNIVVAPNVQVKTWNNALSDSFDNTLIDPSSDLYRQALTLKVGQAVRFSGQFVSGPVDCIREASLTLYGSVSEPDFIIRFSEVSPLAQSEKCSAVTDPNERLTCFYKSARDREVSAGQAD